MISRTALLIAAAQLRDATAATRACLPEQLPRAGLRGSGPTGRALLHLVDTAAGRALLRAVERSSLPGIAAHYRWRKRHIADWTRQALVDGVDQLLVVGAGLDVLGLQCALADPRLRVAEIDRRAASELKRRSINQVTTAPGNLALIPQDLASGSLANALRRWPGHDPTRPTLVIAEGLAMYLTGDQLRRGVRDLRAVLGNDVRLIATAMAMDAGGRPGFHNQAAWVAPWLRFRGEPFRWGVAGDDLPARLAEYHLALQSVADPAAPATPDPCPGEWLFRATLRAIG